MGGKQRCKHNASQFSSMHNYYLSDMHMIAAVILLITVNGLSGSASPWQRLARRTSVRTALANKMDPNFWPTRGRRSDLTHQQRQASDEEGPFWANRGRSISQYLEDNDWPISDDIPFWANRPRSTEEGSPPFWANRGRSTEDQGGPFWANRGRSTDEQGGPFWANRGRSLHDLASTSSEQGPFWANRGRAIEEKTPQRLQRNILYAEEPGWVALPQHGNARRSEATSHEQDDTFWVTRGKRQDRTKREPNMLPQCRHQADNKEKLHKSCRQRSAE